jgi:hypothetical protein
LYYFYKSLVHKSKIKRTQKSVLKKTKAIFGIHLKFWRHFEYLKKFTSIQV